MRVNVLGEPNLLPQIDMQTYCITLEPVTAFGTPLSGDTLFGQLCWTLRHRYGNDRLNGLLEGYLEGQPYAVLSDAFPADYIPLPALPAAFWERDDTTDRKALKAKRWFERDKLHVLLAQWQRHAKSDNKIASLQDDNRSGSFSATDIRAHNTIDRTTGTTGTGMFAPYTRAQIWYVPQCQLQCYAVLDENRLTIDELEENFAAIGSTGYGRDASAGLGKFRITDMQKHHWPDQSGTVCMTLAPCAPQGMHWKVQESYYRIHTRFGRHGDIAAWGSNPFKRPLLMAQTGAVFTLEKENGNPWIGQGIGGVSFMDPHTVHQGYAPVIYLPPLCQKEKDNE